MAVAPEGDTCGGPAPANVANQAAQMRPHLDAARRLAGAQEDRNRTAALGVVDMDRQKAMFVVMGVEQGELLTAMHHIDRVVDVERHRARRSLVAVHPNVNERIAQPDHLAQVRCILQTRHGRLRAQIPPRVRQPAAGQLERRIAAQMIEIIAILVAARDGEDAGPDHVRNTVHDASRIAPLGEYAGQLLGHAEAPVRHGEKNDAAIRCQPATVERGCDLLAGNGWK